MTEAVCSANMPFSGRILVLRFQCLESLLAKLIFFLFALVSSTIKTFYIKKVDSKSMISTERKLHVAKYRKPSGVLNSTERTRSPTSWFELKQHADGSSVVNWLSQNNILMN